MSNEAKETTQPGATEAAVSEEAVQQHEEEIQAKTGNIRLDRMDEIAAKRRQEMINDGGVPHDAFTAEAGSEPPAEPGEPGAEPKVEASEGSAEPAAEPGEPGAEPSSEPGDPGSEPASEPVSKGVEQTIQVPEDHGEHSELAADELDNMKVTIKVDGEEREVTVGELRRTAQKDSAATKRLQQATELVKELQKRAGNTENAGAAPEIDLQSGAEGQPSLDAELKNFFGALYEGDEEKGTQLLKGILEGRGNATQQPPVSVDDLVAQVTSKIKLDAALERFGEDYSDIVADDNLSQVADRFLDGFLEKGISMDKALPMAGEATRKWVKSFAPEQPSQQPSNTVANLDEKRKRKEDASQPVQGLNVKTPSTAEPEQKRQTHSQVIAGMRESRGMK